MANASSRVFLVKKNGVKIASVRNKGVTWSGTPIDTTNDDDDGATSYLAAAFANTSLEMNVDGLTDDDVLTDAAFSTSDADKFFSDLTLERPNGDVISGSFILTNYQETGTYQEAVTFTATIIRNGIHTWTPAV